MTKAEMIAYLDLVLDGIKTRGLVAPAVTRTRLRDDFKKVTAIKVALEKHIPADVSPPIQTALKV